MYIGHVRLCVCVCLSLTACPHYCMDLDVTWRNGRGFPLVVHYWADLQSVHVFCCYDNIARTRNVSKSLFSLYLVILVIVIVLNRLIIDAYDLHQLDTIQNTVDSLTAKFCIQWPCSMDCLQCSDTVGWASGRASGL